MVKSDRQISEYVGRSLSFSSPFPYSFISGEASKLRRLEGDSTSFAFNPEHSRRDRRWDLSHSLFRTGERGRQQGLDEATSGKYQPLLPPPSPLRVRASNPRRLPQDADRRPARPRDSPPAAGACTDGAGRAHHARRVEGPNRRACWGGTSGAHAGLDARVSVGRKGAFSMSQSASLRSSDFAVAVLVPGLVQVRALARPTHPTHES